MYERFTDRARKVMQLAGEEARRSGHEYVGTEHILLGLVREGSGVAGNVLKNLGVDLKLVRTTVEGIIQRGPALEPLKYKDLPQTPRAKKVIEFSIEEARKLGHNYVGTEHLLLGLLREQEGVAAQVLMNLLLTSDKVRDEVLRLLGHPEASERPPIPPAMFPPLPPEVRRMVERLTAEIEQLTRAKQDAVAAQEWERAAGLRDQEANLQRAKSAIIREWVVRNPGGPPVN